MRVGQWRTMDGEAPINATGVLLDGTKVDGPAGAAAGAGGAEGAVRAGR